MIPGGDEAVDLISLSTIESNSQGRERRTRERRIEQKVMERGGVEEGGRGKGKKEATYLSL